jgi:hypothetical protein
MLFQTLNLIVLIILVKVSLSHQFDKGKEIIFCHWKLFVTTLYSIHTFWTSGEKSFQLIELSSLNGIRLVQVSSGRNTGPIKDFFSGTLEIPVLTDS